MALTGRPTLSSALPFIHRLGTGHFSGRQVTMDTQSKREIWPLAIGTALVEAPVAMIAYAILTH